VTDFLNYCIATPVKKFDMVFKKWYKNVLDLRPRPREIIIASETTPKKQEEFTFLQLKEPYIPKKLKGIEERHYRIGHAREKLRRYIIDNTSYDLIFLLDSDVLVPKYAPLILAGIMSLTKSAMVVNLFKHSCGYPPITLGCTLIGRSLYELSLFYPHGYYSEDSVFFTSLRNLAIFGYKFKIILGNIFPVLHFFNGRWEKTIDDFSVKQMLIGEKSE